MSTHQGPTSDVAALYIDPGGPYPAIARVDAWDESRDATRYGGPWPVVAHPPCGPWGRMARLCTRQDPALAVLAVWQVRQYGGVLEHPAHSRLFRAMALPSPGDPADAWGGWTLSVEQCAWGHKARKATWLYWVGVDRDAVVPRLGGVPTHVVALSRRKNRLLYLSAQGRRRTPRDFALWLIRHAATARAPNRGVLCQDGRAMQAATIEALRAEGISNTRLRAALERTGLSVGEFLQISDDYMRGIRPRGRIS